MRDHLRVCMFGSKLEYANHLILQIYYLPMQITYIYIYIYTCLVIIVTMNKLFPIQQTFSKVIFQMRICIYGHDDSQRASDV